MNPLSESGSLGGASLVTELITKQFASDLKRLEADTLASFKRMSGAAEGILSAKTFSGATSAAKGLKTSIDPATDSIRKLQGGVSILQQKLELGEVAERGFTEQTKKLQAEIRDALKGTQDFSKEQVTLYRALGQSERGLKTVAGESSRFGIAQQTVIGLNRQVLDQFSNFGPAGRGAVLGIDAMGGALGAVPIAATAAIGAIGGVVVATGALVQKGKPLLAEYQRSLAILAESGEENLGRFKGELTELQEEGGRAAQAFSRSQLAGALAETVKAGTSASEAMTLLKTGTRLASAENQNLTDSTGLVLKNLRQYSLGVDQAARVGDALAAAGNVASGSAADLSNGLATVGTVAKASGLSLEETLGLLVNLDNKGLDAAEEGATGLRSVLAALSKPSKEAQGAIEGLGVSLTNADGSVKGVKQRLFEVRDAIAASGKDLVEFAAISDTQALTALLALDESTDQYTQTILGSNGALESYSDGLTNTADAAEQRAKVALDDLATTAAEFFAPAIAGAAEALTGLLRGLDTFFSRITGGNTPVDDLTLKFDAVKDVVGSAQDKKTLAGVLDSLAIQLDGNSKTAVKNFAQEIRNGKGDLEDFKAAAQNLLDEAKLSAEIAKVQTELGALESREVAINFSTDLNNVDAVIQEAEARINRSPLVQGKGIQLELGFKEVNGKQVVGILNEVDDIAGETADEIYALNDQVAAMLAQGSQGSALTEEQGRLQSELEATRDRLSGLEGELTTLRASYADTGEAAKAAFREAQDELARTVNELDFGGYTNDLFIRLSIKDPERLQAELKSLVESTKLEIKTAPNPEAKADAQARLREYQTALTAANELVAAEQNIVNVRKTTPNTPAGGPAPDPKPFAAAAASLATLNDKLKEQRELLDNAAPGSTAESAALAQVQSLEAQIKARETLLGLSNQETEIVNRATTANRALGIVKLDVLAAQKQLQDSLLASGGRDITIAASAIGPNYELAESSRQAGSELRILRADIQDQRAAASEATRENAALDAVLKQLAKDIGQEAYREAANNLDLFGEQARIAAKNQGEFVRSFRNGKEEAEGFSSGIKLTSDQLEAQAQVFSDVRSGLKEAAANYTLTGDATKRAADQAQVYQSAIDALVSAGFDPLNPKVQEYQQKLDALTASSARAEAAQQKVATAVGSAKGALDEVKNALGQVDFSKLTEGGPEAVEAYLTKLRDLVTVLEGLKAKNLKAFQLQGGNELLESINKTIPRVENLGDGLEDTGEKAKSLETLKGIGQEILGVFEGLIGTFIEADTELGIFASTATDALGSLVSGDFVGFFGDILGGIVALFTHAAEEAENYAAAVKKYGTEVANSFVSADGKEFSEEGLAEYQQYLDAIVEGGQELADKYYLIDEQGRKTFNEEAFEGAIAGAQRLTDTVSDLEQEYKDVKAAVDSVQDAQLSADEATFEAKLDTQDGAYSVNDIFEEQRLAIGRAAEARDQAYADAAALDAAGQGELANQLRSAADQTYQAELTTINNNAGDRADAIGQNSAEFQTALGQNAADAGVFWTEYWNADTNAQLIAERNAKQQLRREEHVINSQRYTELLNAGYTEQQAYQDAAAGLGYTIDAVSGNLILATDAASQQQSNAALTGGNTVAAGHTTAAGSIAASILNGGTAVTTQAAGTGLAINGALSSVFGNAALTTASQGGALTSTLSSVWSQIAGASVAGSNLFGTALTDGGNLNLGTITSVGNELGLQVVKSGNANSDAQVAVTNTAIKQAVEAAKRQAQNESKLGGELNKTVAGVSNAKIAQVREAFKTQGSFIAAAYNSIIGTIKTGNEAQAGAYGGNYRNVNAGMTQDQVFDRVKREVKAGLIKVERYGDFSNPDFAKVVDPAKYAEQQAGKVKAAEQAKADKANAPKGSLNHIDKQISDLEEQYKKETDPAKRAKLAKQIKALKDQRDKIDVLAEDGKSGGKDGSGKGSSGSGKDIGPKGSPSFIQEQIRVLDEQINKSNSQSKIRDLQKKKEVLQAQLDKLLGRDKESGKDEPAKGSVDYIQKQLQEAQAAYDSATTNNARTAAAERIKVLRNELEEKQALLKDAAKDVQNAVKGEVISIESPLADLGSLLYLTKSVKDQFASLPTSITGGATGGAASITALPESYGSTVLPSYQAQQDATAAFGGHISRFGGFVGEFGSAVREFKALMRSGNSSNPIALKAKGQTISPYEFR